MDPIRWGILGAANIAKKRFIPAVAKTANGIVAAIASRDIDNGRTIAEQFGIARVHDSYEALLADPEIDAIYNPLPNALHAPWSIAAMRAGKHVLCEKPLAVSTDEARSMHEVARETGMLLGEAFMYRLHPQHARVRELLAAGAIGEPRYVRSAFTFLLEPFDPANVRLQRELAGGALMDVGCYCVNAARMLFDDEPQWASAQWDFHPDFGVEVALAGILGFSRGRTAIFDCGFRASGPTFYSVAGTAGRIDVLDAFVPDYGPREIRIADAGDVRIESAPGADPYSLEAEAFARAIVERSPLPRALDDALGTLRAIEALRASAHGDGVRIECSRETRA